MELFIYLGKTGAGMIALYVVYWLCLRKHTYFAFNRFYLLTALLISLGAPFIVLPEKAPEVLPMAQFTMEPTTVIFQPEAAPLMSTEEILFILYGLGVLGMLVRLGFHLWQVMQMIRSGERLRLGKYILVRASDENISSFSFLNYLVLSQKDTEPYGEVVLRHELVHIRQRHSWDLLWVEVVHVFMWFNPALIFYKRSLKEIHEFIADEQATNGDRFAYARTLAGYAFGVSPQVLTNNFFDVSQLKNRIAMLTKNRSSRWVLGRYLLALPVVILLVSLVAARSYVVPEEAPLSTQAKHKADILAKGKGINKKGDKSLSEVRASINEAEQSASTDTNKVFTVVEQHPEFPGGLRALQNYLEDNLRYPEPARKAQVEGKVFVNFIVEKDGSISNVQVLRGLGFGCDEEAVRVTATMPRWKPGMNRGETVAVRYNLPIAFVLDTDPPKMKLRQSKKGETVEFFDNGKVIQEKNLGGNQYSTFSTGTEPLYILDGKEITKSDLNEKINPKDIDNISVLKDESATKIYGEKAKNGVVVITSKNATQVVKVRKSLVEKVMPDDALWLLDGKEAEKEQVEKLSPDSIQSVSVLKGEEATKKHGEKGKNGVIEITTKKN